MRLKSYSAATMSEAMAMVRAELGDDAIIVSTQRASGGQGVRITAALEEPTTDQEITEALGGAPMSPVNEAIRDCLVYHGVPPRLCERLLAAARGLDTGDATMATAGALDELFAFAPLPARKSPTPVMLVGPPGSGKTITVAKLAARARLAGRSVTVITADSVRAGAMEQLSAFTSILGVELKKARGASSLEAMVAEATTISDLVYIDTPGLNPFSGEDIGFLNTLTHAVEVEPVLVMAAGGDPMEATEVAEIFAQAGATRLLATRLDMTRRLGAVLAAADAGQFMFCDVSINPHVANGLCSITPVTMARLLVPPSEQSVTNAPDDWSARRSAQPAPASAPSSAPPQHQPAAQPVYPPPEMPPVENTYADPYPDPDAYPGYAAAEQAAPPHGNQGYGNQGYGTQAYGNQPSGTPSSGAPPSRSPGAGRAASRPSAPLPRLRQAQPIQPAYGEDEGAEMPSPEPEKRPNFFSFLDPDSDTNEARG